MKNQNTNENRLDNLFQNARIQPPIYTFSETQAVFASASAIGISATSFKLLGSSFFKSKFFIMTVTTIALLSSIVFIFNTETDLKTESSNVVFKSEIETNLATSQTTQLASIIETKPTSVQALMNQTKNSIGFLSVKGASSLKSHKKEELALQFPFFALKMDNEDTLIESFIITEKTTEEELKVIQEKAKNAGILMNYDVQIKRNIIRKLNISLKAIDNTEISQYIRIATLPYNKPFAVPIEWETESNGKLLGFNPQFKNGPFVKIFRSDNKRVDRRMKKQLKKENSPTILSETDVDVTNNKIDLANNTLDFPDIMLNRVVQQNYTLINHIINSSTTEAQLNEIQQEALAAGIIFEYQVVYKKEEMKEIVIKMVIRTDDGNLRNDVRINIKKNESFSVPLIWRLDETNKAVDFGDPNQMKAIDLGGN